MCRIKVCLALATLLIIFAVGCIPVVADDFPTETTNLQYINLYTDDKLLASSWGGITQQAIEGKILNRIEAFALLDLKYALTYPTVLLRTRISATIEDPNGALVYAGSLASWDKIPIMQPGAFRFSYFAKFPAHTVLGGKYIITIIYEVKLDSGWVVADTSIHYLTCIPAPITPDVPTSIPAPFLMAFAVIGGMAFIGFNLAKGKDPTPGLFMVFVGATFSWMIGWLPAWVFVTAIALISILSATLWGKLFRRGD